MASSSHYGYSSSSRYFEAFQPEQDHRHLYASLAPWHGLQGVQPAAVLASDLLQPSLQRQHPARSYHQSGPVIYSNQQLPQAVWRPASNYHAAWSGPLDPAPFASRATVYQDDRTVGSSVPHFYRQQHTSNNSVSALHEATSSLKAVELADNPCMVRPDAPPCPPTTLKGAPVAHILNDPLPPPLQPQSQHLATQYSMPWPTETVTAVADVDQSVATIGSYATASSPDTVSGSPWSEIHELGSASASPPYVLHEVDSDWTLVQRPTKARNLGYADRNPYMAPLTATPGPSTTRRTSAVQRRRRAPRTKLATVPSAYTRRQQKSGNSIAIRKGGLSPEGRANAHHQRTSRSTCVRCKFYKRGCTDVDGPCLPCRAALPNSRTWHQPCIRGFLADASLDRCCHGRFDQNEVEYRKYSFIQGAHLSAMHIVWNLPGYGPVPGRHALQIWVQEYLPDNDSDYSEWTDQKGQIIHVRHPPFAIPDVDVLQESLREYLERSLPDPCQWTTTRNPHDKLAIHVYEEFWRLWNRFRSEAIIAPPAPRSSKALSSGDVAELYGNVLALVKLSLVRQGYGTIVSDNVPEFGEQDFRRLGRSPYEAYNRNGRERMLSAVISHQFDVAVRKLSQELEKKITKAVTNMVMFKSPHTQVHRWYELMILLFILSNNLQFLRGSAEDYIASKEGTHLQNRTNKRVGKQIEDWDFAHQMYLAHWDAALRNYRPFIIARENPGELRVNGGFPDMEAFNSFMRMVAIVDRLGPDRFAPPPGPRPDVGRVPYSLSSDYVSRVLQAAGA
ncbi:hypothetical protein K491DRAFT_778874 [Lophiostoma macrostomum CBS 122681]|uniref:Uncharacterized protein n=1 Tax=Lophiostoma macrostomum CBS 122681 TaxID=1314788 RepID=A0A6A6T7N1_9PLEO|nr:hypothetical protein K491DRAFT_778874 [Lophiostoma macrostomum CBS 122681]